MAKTTEKTFEVKINIPTPEEAAEYRRIIAEVKEEDKHFNPAEWTAVEPGGLSNKADIYKK